MNTYPFRLCILFAILLLPCSGFATEGAVWPLKDKTLVVWATAANLAQHGGSVLTIDDQQGHFDGIVFGERAPARWMAGSDFYKRTRQQQNDIAAEHAGPSTLIQLAIVYHDHDVTVYRNGKEYSRHRANEQQLFDKGSAVVIGLRHLLAHDRKGFAGNVDDARIYNIALSAEQIAALEPNKLSGPKPIAWWSFEDGSLNDAMRTFPTGKLLGDARIDGGRLILSGKEDCCFATPPTAVPDPPAVIPHYDSPIHYRPTTDALADTIPFFWKGEYHVFYLRVAKDTPWEHIVSTDLVHWRELPTALVSSGPANEPDGANMFTGSVTEHNGTFHIFYTGHNPRNPHGVEFICHATSPDLVKWTKHPEDVLEPDGVIYDNKPKRDFRDPYVFWNDVEKCWWMVFFGREAKNNRGVQGLATSNDLKHWVFQPPLEKADGQECPDLFRIGAAWYLIGGDHYSVADSPRGPYRKPQASAIDRPNVYAAKRMFDGKRHIWTGWVWDIPTHRDGERSAWGGTQCLPRELYAGPEGQLYSRPVPQVCAVFQETILERQTAPVDAASTFDVPDHYMLECELNMEAKAELTVALRQQIDGKAYRLVLDSQKDEARLSGPGFNYKRPCPIDTTKPVKLQIFVQGTIIECFVNDQYAQTCRAYNYQHGRLAFEVRGGAAQIKALRVKLPVR